MNVSCQMGELGAETLVEGGGDDVISLVGGESVVVVECVDDIVGGESSGSEKAVEYAVLSADVGVEFLQLCVVPGD